MIEKDVELKHRKRKKRKRRKRRRRRRRTKDGSIFTARGKTLFANYRASHTKTEEWEHGGKLYPSESNVLPLTKN